MLRPKGRSGVDARKAGHRECVESRASRRLLHSAELAARRHRYRFGSHFDCGEFVLSGLLGARLRSFKACLLSIDPRRGKEVLVSVTMEDEFRALLRFFLNFCNIALLLPSRLCILSRTSLCKDNSTWVVTHLTLALPSAVLFCGHHSLKRSLGEKAAAAGGDSLWTQVSGENRSKRRYFQILLRPRDKE